VTAVLPDQPHQLDPHRDDLLDVLWVSTVADDEIHPQLSDLAVDTAPFVVDAENPHLTRPVHGTLTVDVRGRRDRELLERLLNGGRALSVTAADGWNQRVRLTTLCKVDAEPRDDGSHAVIATYTWVAAHSFN
jgi:hypothetical protein